MKQNLALFSIATISSLVAVQSTFAQEKNMDMRFEEIKREAQRLMDEIKVPGIAIGIMHDGQVHMAGLGMTNVDDPQAVTEDTVFYIGSISKTFTTTVVLKMSERGEIDLEAPVRMYLPEFSVLDGEASEKARVIDLFQHRTGWQGDYFEDPSSGEDALEKAVRSFRFLPQRTPYGEVWAYNNNNFIIAGRLIQVVSRAKSYEQKVKEELFLPLGMTHSSFFMAELMAERFAVGHAVVSDGTPEPQVSFAPFPRSVYPAGGILSNVSDMMKYMKFQFDGKDKDGSQLLSPKLLDMAHSPLVEGELSEHTGVTWFVEDIGGVRTVFHAGRSAGATAKMLIAPDKKFGIIVLTNSDRGIEVYDAVIALALKKYLDVERTPLVAIPADRSSLEPFVGLWLGDNEDYKIYFDNDQLMAERLYKPLGGVQIYENPPPISMSSAGEDLVIMTDGSFQGTVGELLRDKSGKPTFLSMQHRIFRREE
jgi:CubicO group peptidase (beta-lactamase class C family)